MLAEVLDLGIDLDVWPWVWLAVGVFFAVIELTVLAGSFVLLPFSISAFAASLLGFYNASIEVQWFVFIFGGGVLWILFYRYAQRFAGNNEIAPGVGSPVPGGLTYREAHLACELAAESGGMLSMDLVEVNPILDDKNRTAQMAVGLIQSALGKTIY